MLKILFLISIILFISFLLFFPFWHVGGNYYRGLLLIYNVRPASGGWLPSPDFIKEVTLLKWADPTSFEYVGNGYAKDRFAVYSQYRLKDFDPQTFRQIQAPITGEFWYADQRNLRAYDFLILEDMPNNENSFENRFDIESFEPLGNFIFKDKNGVYSYSRIASFSEDMGQQYGWGNRDVGLYRKHTEVDAETFKVDFCEKELCYGSDKNGKYIMNRTKGANIKLRKIE